ncbi:ubiquinol-cytochrome C chaperone [Salmonella enterica subsp. enterica serovar Virchow]|nr:ubiquinol-cytochrome C chaperone [Salmonella enterica subsp. enterica serovar Virchow]
MFQRLFRRERANRAIVDGLYASIVAAARQPLLYSEIGAPDTPLGRFELITLHMVLALRRLRSPECAAVAQELVDAFFLEVDHSLRELGIGDTGVPKRARKLAKMFYGRAAAYGAALDATDPAALSLALARNVKPAEPDWTGAPTLAAYTLRAAELLANQRTEDLLAGTIRFPDPQEALSNAA